MQGIRKFDRYKMNLCHDGTNVYSYGTLVATVDWETNVLHVPAWYSVTTSRHVNYAADCFGVDVVRGYN